MLSFFKKIGSEDGAIGITTLIVMILLGALGATLINQSLAGSRVSTSYSDGITAQYLAEAGIQHGKALLKSEKFPTDADDIGVINKSLSKVFFDPQDKTRSYSVKISYDHELYQITAIGTTNKAQRQVDQTVSGIDEIYKYTVFGGRSENFFDSLLDRGVSVYPSVNIGGDVGCNTNIHYGAYIMTGIVFGNININGNVTAAGYIKEWPNFGGVTLTSGHHQKEGADEQIIPKVVFPHNYNKSPNKPLDVAGNGHGDYILRNNNTYYTNGNLVLYNHLTGGDTITGQGTILVNGDLILHDNPIPPHIHIFGNSNITGNITLIVNGNIILEPLTSLGGEVLVMATQEIWVGTGIGFKTPYDLAPSITTFPATIDRGILLANGNIFINNLDYTMSGSAISRKTVTLYGKASINYDENLLPKMKKSLSKYTI